MVQIKAPNQYVNEPNAWAEGGAKIAEIGSKLFIIGGEKALEAAAPLLASLNEVNVTYQVHRFSGQVTTEQITAYSELAASQDINVLVGIGGGRVLDLSKAVAQRIHVPSVTVPTIAATCAAWSALTVLYDEEGRSAGYLPLKQSPQLVLADTAVLAAAPKRYLASGIGDTYVKWNETIVNVKKLPADLDVRLGVKTSELAVEVLDRYAQQAYANAGDGIVTPAFHEVSHAIVWLAGQVNTVSAGGARGALAHAIHDSLTQFAKTHGSLHGEKVAFGLIAHTLLQGQTAVETERLAAKLNALGLPVTLAQLGFEEGANKIAYDIAGKVPLDGAKAAELPFAFHPAAIAEAIIAADQLGQRIRSKATAASQ
ncbi:iron-containing alcohol dehydrogenase family protein [Paenibacillus sp. KS-LC4]|uniref:iron-containing alcohol dehydrogenase family protein n=1 Tax=Paenibacillus sp. KS-LC4 TaxID=2979727 RepID=UPI0030D08457